jgi:hypothetical protein
MDIHIYDDLTGSLTGVAFGAKSMDVGSMAGLLNQHLVSGHSTFTGMIADPHSQRIDVASGKLVDCNPAHSVAAHSAAAQIAALETRQQRPLREFALGIPGARERLADLNRQIEALR